MLEILEKTHRIPRPCQEEEVGVADVGTQVHHVALQGGDAGGAAGHEKEASCLNVTFCQ